MKRVGQLWESLVSFENLLVAANAAAAGKRSRPDVSRFILNLEPELLGLRRELRDGSYLPGPYRSFEIQDPKPRRISAAPFRDRVIHHALTQMLAPIFEKRFSPCSYACRTGFGSHRALRAASQGCHDHPYVLKCDVRKYFASMDHEILNGLLSRVIKCRPTLELARCIIRGSNPQEEIIQYFPGDDLFAPFERRRGLPLGNQTSQFFANLYLDPLDQSVKRQRKVPVCVRYVDDLLVFGRTASELHETRECVEELLCSLRLTLHPRKTQILRTVDGVTFLGWRLFPNRKRLVRANAVQFRRRMRTMVAQYSVGAIDWDEIQCRVNAWIAHAAHGNTFRLREQLLEEFAFARGKAV